jgi:hypothetical protein
VCVLLLRRAVGKMMGQEMAPVCEPGAEELASRMDAGCWRGRPHPWRQRGGWWVRSGVGLRVGQKEAPVGCDRGQWANSLMKGCGCRGVVTPRIPRTTRCWRMSVPGAVIVEPSKSSK